MDYETYTIDDGIVQAIDVFITHGCYPGSCTSLLLQEKYEEAMYRAHPHIRPPINGEEDNRWNSYEDRETVWNDHVRFIKEVLPPFIKGENFHTWKGFEDSMAGDVGEWIMLEKLSGGSYVTDLYTKWNKEIHVY